MDLSQEEWMKKIFEDSKAVILDVRSEEELEEGYIPHAKNINFYGGGEFIKQIKSLDKEKNYYVYCRSGSRSTKACNVMNQLGIENTFNLQGGFMGWEGETSL